MLFLVLFTVSCSERPDRPAVDDEHRDSDTASCADPNDAPGHRVRGITPASPPPKAPQEIQEQRPEASQLMPVNSGLAEMENGSALVVHSGLSQVKTGAKKKKKPVSKL